VNEAAVHEGVERLMAGRTVVMVTHRMRTVLRADRVVFLDGGRIVEEGSHDELLRRGGRYADFWAISMAPAASAGVPYPTSAACCASPHP
jgi:ATP-binding cassette subfamily B protein IrtB